MNIKNLNLTVCALGGALVCAPALAAPATGKPDLVVTSAGVLESENQVGADAHLIARIENIGALATKKDVPHGVAFYVDGEFVAWADTYRQDLKPGQFAIVRTNGGPNGRATWNITPGKHTLRAVVDDVSRIDESNEENNAFEATLDWKTPLALNSDNRPEFQEVSRASYQQLRDLQKAGLFQAANTFLRNEHLGNLNQLALDLTRYEASVALARLQDALPDLTSDDNAKRLRAIDAATAGAGHKMSPAKIEALDGDVRGLRVEFDSELQRLSARSTGIEVRNIKTVPLRVSPTKR